MGKALHLIARLYGVEDRAKGLNAEERGALRRRLSAPLMKKLEAYLREIREQVVPKSPAARAVRYALNQWDALTRFLEDGDLEIDNGATERANRDIAIGRGNWAFFGSDSGGRTASVLMSFVASCKRCRVEPFAWFRDVLLPHRRPPGEPARRTASSQLGAADRPEPSLTPGWPANARSGWGCGSPAAYVWTGLFRQH